MKSKIWITNQILKWDAISPGGIVIEKKVWLRAYEIWEHARYLIENANNSFNLSDGVLNLKRCLNQRLKLIEKLYHLKNINIENKQKGYLELLEQYGLVRPFLMKTLLEIRNNIEHNDVEPPDITRCKELLDVVWYFFKSTDLIVQIQRTCLEFTLFDSHGSETQYGYSVDFNHDNNSIIRITGWFPYEFISDSCKDGFCSLIAEEINGKEKWKGADFHTNKLETDIYVSGTIELINNDLLDLYQQMFVAY